MTYTPTAGASKVFYQTRFVCAYQDVRFVAHFKIIHDGADVNASRITVDTAGSAYYFSPQPMIITYVFDAWSGAKNTKVSWRDYDGSNYQSKLHNVQFYDGSSSANLLPDVHTIMYSIM